MGRHQYLHPIEYSVTITASDSSVIPTTRAVYVGVAGNIKVTYPGGEIDTLTNLAAGVWHQMQVVTIHSTSTTATDIHAGY